MGLPNLYLKNDCANPTHSFKDRVVAVASTRALELGFDTLACASTGNLANAVSAYGARGGMKRFVFIPSNLEPSKVTASLIYDPNLIGVNGNYDDVNRLCSEIAGKYKWAFVNINMRPYYAEGSKTLGFEVAEQLGWKSPGPSRGTGGFRIPFDQNMEGNPGIRQDWAYRKRPMRVFAAQAEGCSPVTTAYKAKTDTFRPVKPNTIAKSLAIGNPADGFYALKTIAETNGGAEMATDEEIVDGIKLLARTEGIFAETAGGVTIACLKKLAESKILNPRAVTVAYITGTGLKTQEAVMPYMKQLQVIQPNLAAFEATQLAGAAR